ncbi:MAG: 16S rRNA (cytosine(1402)-N(4))-methyltransferase RsmH [Vicinamibacterales bacterium]
MTTIGPSPSSSSEPAHEPVLVREVVASMAPGPDGVYVDGTLGAGGHAQALLDAGAGRVIGLDRDPAAIAIATARLAGRGGFEAVHADYRDLDGVLAARGLAAVDGVLVDLGVSSMQLDDPSRGFSFRPGPLDMRMDPTTGPTLGDRLATVDEETLAGVIREYGEERHARRVARSILRARDRGALTDTAALASAVRAGVRAGGWQRIDPATRTFMALRLWTNAEIEGLEAFVDAAVARLAPAGRLVVIGFHSLENRIVKQAFRRLAADGTVRLLTRRAVAPDEAEVARNPRARSAQLRAVEKAA